jgi:hypothetical protein
VPFRVGAAVLPSAERHVGRLLEDPRARSLRALIVGVDVLDEDVDERRSPDLRRIAKAAAGLPDIDAAAVRPGLELDVQPPPLPVVRSTSRKPNARSAKAIAASPSS